MVIGASAIPGDGYSQESQRLGVAAYLKKPYRPSTLLETLRRAMKTISPAPATMDRHLQRAFLSRFSGRYLLKDEEGDKPLLFINGLSVSLRPGFIHRNFGGFLLRKGVISAEEHAYYDGKGGNRHEVLVQMGCLEYPELLQEKLSYLTEELVESFGRPPGLQFITVNMPRIFYQGYRHHARPAAGRQILAHYGPRFVALAKDYFLNINFLSLSAEEKLLLSRLDASRTLIEGVGDQEDLLPVLRTLHSLGTIRFAESPFTAAQAEDFPLRLLSTPSKRRSQLPTTSFADLVEPVGKKVGKPAPCFPAPPPMRNRPPSPGGFDRPMANGRRKIPTKSSA